MKVTILVLAIIGSAFTAILQTRSEYVYKPTLQNEDEGSFKISNGEEVFPHSIPYQAYVYAERDNMIWFCSGTLITDRFVLTSGWCLSGANSVEVQLGVHDTRINETGSVRIRSRNLTIHEDFIPNTASFDIGLIELDGRVRRSKTIGYAKLPSRPRPNDSLVGKQGRISGWGLTGRGDTGNSPVLIQTFNTVIPNSECNVVNETARPKTLCLSGPKGNVPCIGDSGVPLVINGVQEGIYSYGPNICVPEFPTVFTRLRSFLVWIETHSNWRNRKF